MLCIGLDVASSEIYFLFLSKIPSCIIEIGHLLIRLWRAFILSYVSIEEFLWIYFTSNQLYNNSMHCLVVANFKLQIRVTLRAKRVGHRNQKMQNK